MRQIIMISKSISTLKKIAGIMIFSGIWDKLVTNISIREEMLMISKVREFPAIAFIITIAGNNMQA